MVANATHFRPRAMSPGGACGPTCGRRVAPRSCRPWLWLRPQQPPSHQLHCTARLDMMQDGRGVGAGGAVGHGQWAMMAMMVEFAIVDHGIAYEARKRGHSVHDAPSRLFERVRVRVRVASHCPVAWTMTDAGWDDKWAEEMLVPCWASSECSKLWSSKRVVSLLPPLHRHALPVRQRRFPTTCMSRPRGVCRSPALAACILSRKVLQRGRTYVSMYLVSTCSDARACRP